MSSVVPESIEYHIASIPVSLLMTWLVWLVIGAASLAALKTARRVPHALQSVFEMCFESITGMIDEAIGSDAARYYPLFIGVFLYVFVGNLIGLIPGLISPTSDLNVTVGLALVVFVYYNFMGFRRQGLGYLKHFFGPPLPWYMFPIRGLMFVIEMIGNFARPFSLALRLFCNIFAKEILLGILAFLMLEFFFGKEFIVKGLSVGPLFLRPFILLLGLMVGFIQALIFMVLSVSYVAGAVKLEEH